MRIRFSRPAGLLASLLAGLLIAAGTAGCSEDVNPVAGTDHVFSFYGVLTPQADTQWVRVFPVEMRLEPAHAPSIDAVVTSTDQQTGARQTWRDTVLTVFDGGPDAVNGYFFWAPLTPGYGNAYRIDVERSDGVAAHATAFGHAQFLVIFRHKEKKLFRHGAGTHKDFHDFLGLTC